MENKKSRYARDADGQWWWTFKDGRRTRVSERTCAHCGEVFVAYFPGVCCSRKCAAQMRRPPEKPLPLCAGCGQSFRPRGGGQRFCGHACAATTMHALRNKTTSIDDRELLNNDNPRFSQDADGQWWYQGRKGRTRAHIKECAFCKRRALKSIFHRSRYCSPRCGLLAASAEGRRYHKGPKAGAWSGGRKQTGNGYVAIYTPEHPSVKDSGRPYVLEHRIVMEQMLGRTLEPHEQVHHRNGIKTDNRPENLELWAHQQPAGQRPHEKQHCPSCTCFKEPQ